MNNDPATIPPAAPGRVPVPACPLCGGRDFTPVCQAAGHPVVCCTGCRLHRLNPQPSDAELAEIYHPHYSFFGDDPGAAECVSRAKQATADHYLHLLARAGVTGGGLLEVGCGDGDFLLRAARRNFSVEGIDYSPHSCAKAQAKLGPAARIHRGEIGVLADRRESYDLCVACDVIEHVRRPDVFLQTVHRLLRPGGRMFLVTPDLDYLAARLMRSRWLEFKAEHMYYYTPRTLQRQLVQAGFTDIRLLGGTKLLSLDYVTRHFITYPVVGLTPALRLLRAVLPVSWVQRPWLLPAGGMIALARKPGR
ncbi:MAG: class I SAM-dependent methyltransferase [Opitutae bacterium]|nr:class I SAM-dependent methyltransferase [Opitutae bacterium]